MNIILILNMEARTATIELQKPFCFYLTCTHIGFSQMNFKDMETHAMKLDPNAGNNSTPTGKVV
jgi:hypothetical protein